jgi:hypothetical protein
LFRRCQEREYRISNKEYPFEKFDETSHRKYNKYRQISRLDIPCLLFDIPAPLTPIYFFISSNSLILQKLLNSRFAKLKKIYRMNVKQAKILLEKINRLFQSMTMDEHVSEIEKELMRNYVKSLYEEFMPDGGVKAVPIQKAAPIKVAPPISVERVVEIPPPPPKVEVVPIPRPAPRPTAVETPKVEMKVPPVRVAPPPPAPKPVKLKISEEHEDLFEFQEATDLSERLSQSPIKDLNKAMGINERILTTNELFDGNGDALKDALSTINRLSNFDEAKDYLANIAEIYDWASKKKKKKAKIFVKLVRRRFT